MKQAQRHDAVVKDQRIRQQSQKQRDNMRQVKEDYDAEGMEDYAPAEQV